jgi:hypothetical protein
LPRSPTIINLSTVKQVRSTRLMVLKVASNIDVYRSIVDQKILFLIKLFKTSKHLIAQKLSK